MELGITVSHCFGLVTGMGRDVLLIRSITVNVRKMTAINTGKEEPLLTFLQFETQPDLLLLDLLPGVAARRPANIPVTALCCCIVTPIVVQVIRSREGGWQMYD